MEKLGWNKSSLGELGKITSSKRIFKSEYVKEGVPFYRTKEVKNLANGNDIATELFIKKERFDEIVDKFGSPKEGDILLTAIGTIGEIYVVKGNNPFYFKDGNVLWLKDFDSLDKHFLRYALMAFVDELRLLSRGAAYNALPINKLKNYEIFVPTIPEQKRIVAILDQAFADIEQARAKTEQNLKNARELYESYLQQVFSQRSEGVIEVPLSDITESISDGDHAAPPKSEEGIPFITISNINKLTNEIDFTNTFKVPESYYSALKITRKPLQGDVLYTVTGSYGIPVIVKEEIEFCFQRHIGLVRPNNETDSNWLYYLLMSPQVFKQADEGATGTAQKTVSLKLLRSLRVPKVPLADQINMVEGLNFMYQKSKQLTEIYTRKLESLDELKKSILQKAFSGELTKTLDSKTSKGAAA